MSFTLLFFVMCFVKENLLFVFFFFKAEAAYDVRLSFVGLEKCIRGRVGILKPKKNIRWLQ